MLIALVGLATGVAGQGKEWPLALDRAWIPSDSPFPFPLAPCPNIRKPYTGELKKNSVPCGQNGILGVSGTDK